MEEGGKRSTREGREARKTVKEQEGKGKQYGGKESRRGTCKGETDEGRKNRKGIRQGEV